MSYPLPQRGELHATGETCPDCGAPIVEVVTARGPWRICVNMNCPGKEKKAASRAGRGRGTSASAKASGAKRGTRAKSTKSAKTKSAGGKSSKAKSPAKGES